MASKKLFKLSPEALPRGSICALSKCRVTDRRAPTPVGQAVLVQGDVARLFVADIGLVQRLQEVEVGGARCGALRLLLSRGFQHQGSNGIVGLALYRSLAPVTFGHFFRREVICVGCEP